MTSGENNPWRSAALPLFEPESLAAVLSEASDVTIILDSDGKITFAQANVPNTPFGDLKTWVGRNLSELLTEECQPKLRKILAGNHENSSVSRVELNHKDGKAWQFPVKYSVHRLGYEKGAILMLGRDLRQVAETQQQLVKAQLALEQGYEQRREFDARYRMLLSVSREAFVLVSVSDGRINDLNDSAVQLLGGKLEQWQGQLFAKGFKDVGRAEFVQNILALALSTMDADVTFEAAISGDNLIIKPTSFRAGGERMLLCRLEAESSSEQTDSLLTSNLDKLFRKGTEAIVFTDANGVIEAANSAFLGLVDFASRKDVRGTSLSEYMARGQIDLNVLIDNAVRAGAIRTYATQLCNDVGVWTPVDISVSHLNNRAKPAFGFVIRDARRAEPVHTPDQSEAGMVGGNVAELVGSAPLKEIVAQTTDVIERMCIETAIEMTSNNRAAAAEMLGLSRQSLYVKLHKYGLQGKPDRN